MMMESTQDLTVCFLGCGNLGTSILKCLLSPGSKRPRNFSRFIACVRSEKSGRRLARQFPDRGEELLIAVAGNVHAVRSSNVIILGADPADVGNLLKEAGLTDALNGKLLISIAAGWTRSSLEKTLYGSTTTADNQHGRAWVLRTLPNIAASVSQSMTTIEISEPSIPQDQLLLANSIFQAVGETVHIPPRLMPVATVAGGSTPAFFSIICDALIDASVNSGLPRDTAQTMIYQAMQGTASLLQSGIQPGQLKDIGTSPEGCTIGGVMVLEESAVRGHVGRALRESVAIARQMGNVEPADH